MRCVEPPTAPTLQPSQTPCCSLNATVCAMPAHQPTVATVMGSAMTLHTDGLEIAQLEMEVGAVATYVVASMAPHRAAAVGEQQRLIRVARCWASRPHLACFACR
jgi:hypothetical protein